MLMTMGAPSHEREQIKNEDTPNMPALNPKTNFRYQGDQSSLNGIAPMQPIDAGEKKEMTIEETLAAMD